MYFRRILLFWRKYEIVFSSDFTILEKIKMYFRRILLFWRKIWNHNFQGFWNFIENRFSYSLRIYCLKYWHVETFTTWPKSLCNSSEALYLCWNDIFLEFIFLWKNCFVSQHFFHQQKFFFTFCTLIVSVFQKLNNTISKVSALM